GEVIGTVGIAGCGKSTMLKVMAGQMMPDKSDIGLDFENCQKLNWNGVEFACSALYQSQVGLVSQESHHFRETIAFNITRNANDRLEPKNLSAGQRQLLAAVRACYLKITVVLLDEISSALDSDLEEALREVVQLIQSQCLTFIVAHRLETVIRADRILVMDN